jgi:hypothetical protein
MSGFIHALVARNSGEAVAVFPRLPSLFESPGRIGQTAAAAQEASSGIPPHPAPKQKIEEMPAPFSPKPPAASPEAVVDRGAVLPKKSPGRGARPAASIPEEANPAGTRPDPVRDRNSGEVEPHVPKLMTEMALKASHIPPAAEESFSSRTLSTLPLPKDSAPEGPHTPGEGITLIQQRAPPAYARDADLPRESIRRSVNPGEERPDTVPGRARVHVAPGRSPAARQGGEVRPVPVRHSRSIGDVRDGRGNPEAEGTASQEPAIHVTIGRIEVRAMQPPSVRRREHDPREETRLDEYLKRRDGGDRR